VLNLFYEEPDPDRWFPGDRYPRQVVRRIVRGKPQPGGQTRVFLNLCAGLDRIGARFRINEYSYALRHPDELVCIIGKPLVLDKIDWRNPILFGASGYSEPVSDPRLLDRLRVRKVLVPGPWVEKMCKPYWGDAVEAWPVGIDTDAWKPAPPGKKTIDVLLYDKVRWNHEQYEISLIEPIRDVLRRCNRSFVEIRYGSYNEAEYRGLLDRCRTLIFLCEHETQGLAYQEALSSGLPIFAWDRGGAWQDPAFYPHRVVFEPVSSVPYWDERCGLSFADIAEFEALWHQFWDGFRATRYEPRSYITENLTLEKCARKYLAIASALSPT
jgi:glycosyltransferase involved in cell wall biosynthesis